MPVFTATAVAITGLAAGTFIDGEEIIEMEETSEDEKGDDQ
ncbi:hypothetical protein [Bradyrhizobium daqingense]